MLGVFLSELLAIPMLVTLLMNESSNPVIVFKISNDFPKSLALLHVCLAFLLYLLELGDFKALLDVPKLYLFGHDLFQGAIQLPFQAHYQYGLRLALAGHPA